MIWWHGCHVLLHGHQGMPQMQHNLLRRRHMLQHKHFILLCRHATQVPLFYCTLLLYRHDILHRHCFCHAGSIRSFCRMARTLKVEGKLPQTKMDFSIWLRPCLSHAFRNAVLPQTPLGAKRETRMLALKVFVSPSALRKEYNVFQISDMTPDRRGRPTLK